MGDTTSTYDGLMILKRINKDTLDLYLDLNNRRDVSSNNLLVICRTKKDCEDAIRSISRNYLNTAKIHMSSLKVNIDKTNIIFIPIKSIRDKIIGQRFKEFYFNEEFNI